MTSAGYASIASSVGGAIQSYAGFQAAKTTINANLQATLKNIESGKEATLENLESNRKSYLTRLNATYEQEEAINQELGTVMSRRGIEAMKANARLKTAGASTGLSGASIQEITNQTNYDEILDNQILISRARRSKSDLSRQRVVEWLNFKTQGMNAQNQLVGTITGGTGNGNAQALASGLGSALGGITDYLKMGGTFDFGGSSNTYSDGSPMTNITANE